MTAKYAHISCYKRSESLGGVAKFGMHLERAIPELVHFSWSDSPRYDDVRGVSEDWKKAQELNGYLLSEGLVGPETTAIVDGFWGMGLAGKVKRLVSVVHGTYFGHALATEINPVWDAESILALAQKQVEFWNQEGVETVAVGSQVAREFKMQVGRWPDMVIPHGVDTEVFKPDPGRVIPNRVIHVAGAGQTHKGADLIPLVQELLGDEIELVYLGVHTGEEADEAAAWQTAAVAFFPSRYEGNPYAWLEAMSCGVPIVAYMTGLGRDLPLYCGKIVDDYHPQAFARAIENVLAYREKYRGPRRWIEKNATRAQFEQKWREFLC